MYPAVFRELQPRLGFAWATRIIAFIALSTLLFSLTVMKRRISPPMKRRLFDLNAWREPPFTLFSIGGFIVFLGLYIPFFFITPFAVLKTGASEEFAFYFVPILNAASTLGRIIPNFIADIVGPLNVLFPCTFIAAGLAFCWTMVHDINGLVTFAVCYGFFSGAFVSLPPATVASLSPDMKSVGTRMGMSFCLAGFGLLIGAPTGGALLHLRDKLDFFPAQMFCGAAVAAGAFVMMLARITKVGLSLTAKA